MSELFGVNGIEVAGTPRLLTAVAGGSRIHLVAAAEEADDGRGAVLDSHLHADRLARAPALAIYDRAALTEPR